MPTPLDLSRWPRREHFEFFRRFESPFFNVCAPVDVSALWAACKAAGGPSFAIACFHRALAAANALEPFRLRIRGDGVIVHEVLHGGTTALRDDGSFGFAYFDFDADFGRFAGAAAAALTAARSQTALETRDLDDAVIHFSVLPWVRFTSISHARRFGLADSVPKIVFGKVHLADGRWWMPVSVEVHHAVMDGLHVGQFFAAFQDGLATPPE